MLGGLASSRDRVRRWDWGLCLALALGLVAAAPFLGRPGLPHQTDAELHVYRAAELGHTLRGGAFYPRWAPDLYLGYGYPIFNYYAPLTYYLANLFDLFPSLDIVEGVKAVFVLGLLLASVGAYLLGRELFGPLAGMLGAASFVFSPYVVFIDSHARGDLAEQFSICLIPLAFYAFCRLMSGAGGRGALLGSVLALAATVLSHALLGLVTGMLLLAYWFWVVILGPGRRRAGWGGLVLVLAALLIAFYWLPFLLERGAIKLNVVGPGHFDFREHFLSLSDLLGPSRILDMGATAPRFRYNLGLAQWLLALPAVGMLVLSWIHRVAGSCRSCRVHLLFFVTASLGLILMMWPVATLLWEHAPGVRYLQFPWRLLGPANAMLAVCVGGTVLLIPAGRWRDLAAAVGLLTILALALPVLYPPMWGPDFGGVEPLDIIAWEQQGSLALGTTSTGDFVPVGAALVLMHPQPSLIGSYAQPGPVDRVNRATLPKGTTAEIVEQRALYDRFAVTTPKEFVFRLYTFYFPGWRAYVDGEEVPIDVAGPEGFITFWVPAGEHEVVVRFEDTPPRTVGWSISVAGLLALGAAMVLIRSSSRGDAPRHSVLNRRSLAWVGGALLLFVVVKIAVIDPRDGWLRRDSPPGQAYAAQHNLRVDFGHQIELLGYDLPQQCVRPGEKIQLVLYWHALAPMDKNYQTFAHLAQPLDRVWAQEDHLNPGMRHGGTPTTLWPLDKYVWDEYEISVPTDTPPGEYALFVGLYLLDEGYRLPVYDEAGQVVGDGFVIAPITVEH
jgi:hypothetical protein